MLNTQAASDPRLDFRFVVIAAGIFAAASAAAAGYQLGGPSLWVDEAYTWFFVTMDWQQMVGAVRIDGVNPPLFYVYVKAFSELLGTSEAALRFPSALAHVVGTAAAVWLGYQTAGRVGSLAGGWFYSFHPMLLWFARDARPYAMAAALAVVSFALLQKLKYSEYKFSVLATAVISVALGLLVHYFFLLFAAVTGLLAIADIKRSPSFLRQWLTVLLLSMLPLLVWIWWFLQLPEPSFGIGWIQSPSPLDPLITGWNLLSGYAGAFNPGSFAFGLLAAILFVFGLRKRWPLVALSIATPIMGVWLLSQFRPVYVDRYFVVLIPFFIVTITDGAGTVWRWVQAGRTEPSTLHWILFGLIAALATSTAVVSVHRHPAYEKENWRAVGHWLERQDATAELLFSEPEIQLPLAYYIGRDIRGSGETADRACEGACIWVLRQPYTYTHALTQSVSDPARPTWQPDLPEECELNDRARTEATGVTAWLIDCDE